MRKLTVFLLAFLTDAVLELEPDTIPPDSPLRVPNPYFTKFLALARHGDPRITLLSGRFEDLAAAIPDIVAQTERERHAERMRNVMQSLGNGQRQ